MLIPTSREKKQTTQKLFYFHFKWTYFFTRLRVRSLLLHIFEAANDSNLKTANITDIKAFNNTEVKTATSSILLRFIFSGIDRSAGLS